jgi:putative transposase
VTANPNGAWVTQQARNLLLALDEQGGRARFVVRDHDAKFCRSFDDVFSSEGGEVLVTPVRAPQANAYAERWVRTVRTECLDWLLIVGRGHLEQVLQIYVQHYNAHRPHQALGLQPPDPPARLTVLCQDDRGTVCRRDLLGGLLHEYRQAAGTTLRTPQVRAAAGELAIHQVRGTWSGLAWRHFGRPVAPARPARRISSATAL